MQANKPIFWHQGLFLQPHHFQLQERYFHSLLDPFRQFVQPYTWGAASWRVDEPLLLNQTFDLTEGSFIFQDGTWVTLPGNGVLQARSFKAVWTDTERPFKVYLGLHKWESSEENVTVLEQEGDVGKVNTRLACNIVPQEIKDMHHSGPTAHVRLMQYTLKVFWESEIPSVGDYHLLPVAELESDRSGVHLSEGFAPPSVVLNASPVLLQIAKNIRELVASRTRSLEEYKVPRDVQTAEFESGYTVFLLALRSLNRYLPPLHHATETPVVHPWAFYGLLRQLVGELSTFSDRVNALGRLPDGRPLLPDYDHENPGPCFEEAQTLIEELLNAILVGPEGIIDLVREGEWFRGIIPATLFDSRNVFYLVVRTAEDRQRSLDALRNLAKSGSIEMLPTLLARALPGLPMQYNEVPPPGLPKRPGSLYFRLDQAHGHWLEIMKRQNFCLYWDNAPADTKAELIVVRK